MSGLTTRRGAPLSGLVALLMVASAYGAFNGNKSIKVEDGTQSGGHSTVNGSITVGRDASIDGSLETVNGTIRVDENSRIKGAKTVNGSVRLASGVTAGDVGSVNGSIRIAENVTLDGEVAVVNGRISVGKGSRVTDNVSNVNGEIHIAHAEIGGNLSTVNGDVWLTDNAVLSGDLIVEKAHGWGRKSRHGRKPKVVIGPGSTVAGDIVLEREVELYISETAKIGNVTGQMSMADAVRFSGAEP